MYFSYILLVQFQNFEFVMLFLILVIKVYTGVEVKRKRIWKNRIKEVFIIQYLVQYFFFGNKKNLVRI